MSGPTKISGLPAASTLGGTEVVAGVQSSNTVKILISAIATYVRSLFTTTPLTVPEGGTGVTTSTGSGSVVLGTSPTLTTPTMSGVVTGGTYSGATLTNPANTTQALTDGATIAWDTSLGAVATVTIAGNRTMSAPTNLKTGGRYVLHVTQDATGGRTLAFNAVFKNTGGATTLPVPNPSVNTLTTYIFDSPDGTSLILTNFYKQSTRTVATTGSAATYTVPIGCTRINVRLVGGGGGGGAATTNAGTAGNNTTFGASLTAGGGLAGSASGAGGGGGSATGGDINILGSAGSPGGTSLGTVLVGAGNGGASALGGSGLGGSSGVNGSDGAANSGGGGGGGGQSASATGGGGGSGGYVEKLIIGPAATYTYTVGATANGGVAGGQAGGKGAAGIIIVDEFYN